MLINKFKPIMLFQAVDKGDGGDSSVVTPKTAPASDQTDFAQLYTTLSQKIQAGEYVSQKSYATLQAKYQAEFDAHKAVTDELTTAKTRLTELEGNVSIFQTEKATLETTVKEKETALTSTQEGLDRLKLIMKDHPELISFEVEGLLPNVPLDALPEALKKFSEKLGTIQTTATNIVNNLTASTDPPSGVNQRTVEVVQKEMNRAAMEGRQKDYDVLREEYFKLTGVPEAKK